jgi:predicted O-methyltransferase YrrM
MTTAVLRRLFGYRPAQPWISYAAASEIAKALDPTRSVVLEFGSGTSTVWLAERSAQLYSVEDSEPWFGRVSEWLRRSSVQNVVYALRSDKNGYIHFPEKSDVLFDFVLIDGTYRSDCLKAAVGRLKPGGLIYLDDCDKDTALGNGDMREAEAFLREIAGQGQGQLTYYSDLAPTQCFVKQGALYKALSGSLI